MIIATFGCAPDIIPARLGEGSRGFLLTLDYYLFREKQQDEPNGQDTIRISSSHIALFDTYKECYDAVAELRNLYEDMVKTIKAAKERHESEALSILEKSSKQMIHVGLVDNK